MGFVVTLMGISGVKGAQLTLTFSLWVDEARFNGQGEAGWLRTPLAKREEGSK